MCFLRKRFIQFLLALFLSKVLPGIVTIFMEWLKTLHSIICFPSRLPHVPNILSNVCGYGYWYTWICTGLSDIYTARAIIKNMGQQMSGLINQMARVFGINPKVGGLDSPSGRDFFCLKNFDTFTRTSVRVSKMNAVARSLLTFEMLTLVDKYIKMMDDWIHKLFLNKPLTMFVLIQPAYKSLKHIEICIYVFMKIYISKTRMNVNSWREIHLGSNLWPFVKILL